MKEISPEMDANQSAKKSIFIKDLRPNDTVHSTFLVRTQMMRTNRSGQPILSLHLTDSTGQIEAEINDGVELIEEIAKEGTVVAIAGRVYESAGRRKISLRHVVPLDPSEIQWEDYSPQGVDRHAEYARLIEIFENLSDPWIRDLGTRLLRHPEIASRYPDCPAAKSIHHAYPGGLLMHSLQLIRVVDAIAPLYPHLNRDILVFGAAFHDFAKVFELRFQNAVEYTDEGKLLGHISIGQVWVDRIIRTIEGFPKSLEIQLKHIILSHHGRLEYGSPKVPQTLEAIVVSQLDDLDSKLDSVWQWMKGDNGRGRWTSMHKAYQISYFRPDSLLEE